MTCPDITLVAQLISELHDVNILLSVSLISLEYLSHLRHCSKPWGYSCEQDKVNKVLTLMELAFQRDRQETKKRINHMELPLGINYFPETVAFE